MRIKKKTYYRILDINNTFDNVKNEIVSVASGESKTIVAISKLTDYLALGYDSDRNDTFLVTNNFNLTFKKES